jgi:hypothetical protein
MRATDPDEETGERTGSHPAPGEWGVDSDPRPGSPRVVIHIGFPKAGSTWLQRELLPRVRNARMVPRTVVRRELLVPSPLAFDARAARRAVLGRGAERVLLSEEELAGNLHTGGLHGAMSKEIAERLARAFPDAHVVILLRNQLDMIASAYKQYVEGGGTGSIHRFLRPARSPHKTPNFSLDFLAYDAQVRRYESLFGEDAVHVYPFEDLRRDGGAFVLRLASDLDLDLDPAEVSYSARNVGYRRGTRRIVRVLNHFHDREIPNTSCLVAVPGLYPLLKRLAPRLNRFPWMGRHETLRDFLDADSIDRIAERYREPNESLAKRRHLGLAAHGYPMPRNRGRSD